MSESSDMVLVVEDNDDDLFALKRALKKAGIVSRLHVVSDGRQAIDYLSGAGSFADRAQFPLPTLMLLDLKMPLCDGFDVLTWMRQRPELAAIAVVVLTGSDEVRDHQRAYALGARSYLVKPPTPADLQGIVKTMQTLWAHTVDSAAARTEVADPAARVDDSRGPRLQSSSGSITASASRAE